MLDRPGAGEPHRRFTAVEVLRMVEAGTLGEDNRVELIDGELLLMSPQNPFHAAVVSRLNRLLLLEYGDGFSIRVQCPLAASPGDLPEPNLVVARGSDSVYLQRPPGGPDCVLVLEVCRISEARDRRKAAVYAAAGVPVFGLVDLSRGRVEVHCQPDVAAGYKEVRVHPAGEEIPLPERPDRTIPARVLLSLQGP